MDAQQKLTVAKLSFLTASLKADPTSVPRDKVTQFQTVLSATLDECSKTNVRKCSTWILKNTTSSAAKAAALGSYLVAFSKSFDADAKRDDRSKPSSRKRRLYVLYLMNDVLHRYKHDCASVSASPFVQSMEPHIIELFALASSCGQRSQNKALIRRIEDIVSAWEEQDLLKSSTFRKIREAVKDGEARASEHTSVDRSANSTPAAGQGASKEEPYIVPAQHGDSSTPWCDLPAACMLPHITPGVPEPIDPRDMRPVPLRAGPANPIIVNAVKDLLKEVDNLFNEDEGIVADIDQLGEKMVRDPHTGELTLGPRYYGWSAEFCERVKKGIRARNEEDSRGRGRSSSRSRPRSMSSSPEGKRRRRYSSSLSRSRSRSRSPSRDRQPRSYSNNRYRNRSDSPPDSRPSRPSDFSRAAPPAPYTNVPPPPHQPPYSSPIPPPSFPPPPFPQQHPPFPPLPGPNGLPIPPPPPPPPNYTGPWPPPPPPLIPPGGFQAPPFPAFPPPPQQGGYGPYGGTPGVPPPPPPPLGGQVPMWGQGHQQSPPQQGGGYGGHGHAQGHGQRGGGADGWRRGGRY